MAADSDYRTRIYEHYSAGFQDLKPEFDAAAARRWGRAYRYYFRGWLPAHKDAAVVDLACGGGALLYFFKQHGYSHIAGVDISPDQVQLARQVVPHVQQGNVLEFLEQNRGAFDLITGLDIVEHFHKDEVLRFLDGCYAALKPGGRMILQTPNAETPWAGMHRYNDFTHEVCFNPNALMRLMRLCGFSDTAAREQGPVPWGYSLPSTARFVIWSGIRFMLKVWNLAECGDRGSGVFTRVMLATGVKQPRSA